MTSLPAYVDGLLADPLAAARRLAGQGRRIVGVTSGDIPVELVAAAGAFAVALPCPPGATPRADTYLEATFSPFARTLTEQWLTGTFDFMEAVIFPRSNDSLQRVYYYLCELQRHGVTQGPQPLLFDVAKIPRDTSMAHTLAATERLAAALQTQGAVLPEAIARRNRRRRLMEQLRSLRRDVQAPPPGPLVERIARAADLDEADAFDGALEQWLRARPSAWTGPRLLLAGSPPPDERLHVAAEAAGGRIVEEFGDHAADLCAREVPASGAPLQALARHHATLRTGARSFEDRAAVLVERARDAQVQGVVLWIIEEDESLVWDVPAMKAALAEARIPLLALTRQRWDAPASTQIADFLGQLRGQP